MTSRWSTHRSVETPLIAGNGLVDRRALLGRGIAFAGAIGTGVGVSLTGAATEPLSIPQWSRRSW
jgi:sulfane dehydrogenase subunit SoxC